jgi:glycosyltransferase involved in cell wall biosynthesis
LYSAADLFLFPSLYEGFGLPLLEAMACGVPVLASDTSSLPEVGGGGTAVLLPPNAQNQWTTGIRRLLTDTQKRQALVAAGFHQIKKFTWEKTARQLLSLYASLGDGR